MTKLYRGRSPNFILLVDHEDLPSGAFVRPIRLEYVPKETLERLKKSTYHFNPEIEDVCYTAKGMRLIPKFKIKEVV